MIIRREAPDDYPRIDELSKVAFQSARVAGADERDYLGRLRLGGGYIPELALVADEKGELAGYVMLTKADVIVKGEAQSFLLLASLLVVLDQGNKGLGASLLRDAMVRANVLGYGAVFVIGDPAYYSRFGFVRAAKFGVKLPGVSKKSFMALELKKGALSGARSGVLMLP